MVTARDEEDEEDEDEDEEDEQQQQQQQQQKPATKRRRSRAAGLPIWSGVGCARHWCSVCLGPESSAYGKAIVHCVRCPRR